MKKRSTEILQRLLVNPNEELSLRKLADEYHVSEKTLKNDIQEIMEFTEESGYHAALFFDSQKLRFHAGQNIRGLANCVYAMNLYQYKMSPQERKIYIAVVLVCCQDYYSMQQLADELFVTRNTIINDCRLADEFFASYGIVFKAKSKRGIRIETDEEKTQSLLIGLFQELIPNLKSEKAFFVQFIIKKAGFIYPLKDVVLHMNSFTKEQNLIFAEDVFFEAAVVLFVLVNRLWQAGYQGGRQKEERQAAQLDLIGNLVDYVVKELGYSSLGREGILAIEKQILSRRLQPQVWNMDDFGLYTVICHFLLEISRQTDADIQYDSLLIESLISHIKGMNNWNDADYEWDTEYGNNDDFIRIREISEDKFYILERYLQSALTEKMKDSITIHICAAMLRGRNNDGQLSVIVSCPGSMATSKYLEAQIRNYFNFRIVDTMTARQVEEAADDLRDADFIISTVPIRGSVLPVAVVSPLITVDDIQKIQNIAFKQKSHTPASRQPRYPVLEKVHAIYESGNNRNISYLDRELQQILDDFFYMDSRSSEDFELLKMLELKYIKIVDERLEWRQAMKEASKDLIRDGYFDENYVREAIGNIEEYGCYIIVSKGIALAHASKEAGVYADGISLLVSREGIIFDEGDPVHLLFFFSQKGEMDYLDLFKEILKLGSNPEDIDRIRRLSDIREVYRSLWEILSDDESKV